jgi:hypothetical protein
MLVGWSNARSAYRLHEGNETKITITITITIRFQHTEIDEEMLYVSARS